MPNLKDQWRRLINNLKRHKSRLPLKLYLSIIELMERREDLYNLLFVSRDFHTAAEKRLYSSINLTGLKPTSHHRFFQTILSRERIARHIQSLTISSPPGLILSAENYWHVLHKVLCATPNLKKLYWLALNVLWPQFTFRIFSGCTTLRLHTLVFHAQNNTHLFFDYTFLDLQTELIELNIRGHPPISFPPKAFPKLTNLTISCRDTGQLITRPNIRAVHFLEQHSITTTPFPTPNNIASLRLHFYVYYSSEHFSRIFHAFPHLRFLRIDNIALDHFLHLPEANHLSQYLLLSSWNEWLDFIVEQTAHITSLEKISLHFLSTILPDDTMNNHGIASDYPGNLKAITVEYGSKDSTDICVQWRRGTKGGQIIEPNEEEWVDKHWN